jgi:hypothetical protein
MKYFLMAGVIFLYGCGDTDTSGTQTLEGSADVNLNNNFAECQIRQNVNSLIVKQTGADEYIFIFDPLVGYADEFVDLATADALRISPLSVDEQAIIDGSL